VTRMADRSRCACAAAKRKTIVVLARHSVPERVTIVVMAWGEQRRSPVTIFDILPTAEAGGFLIAGGGHADTSTRVVDASSGRCA
jgi:hypothetical protein